MVCHRAPPWHINAMIRRLAVSSLLLLAACSTTSTPPPQIGTAPVAERPAKIHEAGLERVMGKSAKELVALLGDPDLDGREGAARRLQFVGPACVMDAYLYPAKEGGEPVVSYIDTRLSSGEDMDRASCIAALTRRAAAP
jgi:hypothetical protein